MIVFLIKYHLYIKLSRHFGKQLLMYAEKYKISCMISSSTSLTFHGIHDTLYPCRVAKDCDALAVFILHVIYPALRHVITCPVKIWNMIKHRNAQ